MKVRGYLLYSPSTRRHFFRVYNPDNREEFVDYDLCAEDIEIEVVDQFVELKRGDDRNRLDYTDKVLGKK